MVDASYNPEKWIWTDADFETMSWHDCKIYAFASIREPDELIYEFALDLDYLCQWICSVPGAPMNFAVAPATLVFHYVTSTTIHVDSVSDLTINRVYVEKGDRASKWIIKCFGGVIEVVAFNFTQYIRRPPVLCQQQSLTLKERGGISFDRTTPEKI